MDSQKIISLIRENNKFEELFNNLSPKTPYKITGLSNGAKSFLSSGFLLKDKVLFIVCSTKEDEDMFISFFDFLDIEVDIYPTLEISPYENIFTDTNLIDKQYQVIERLLTKQAKVVITKTKALSQKLLTVAELKSNLLTLRVDMEISPDNLIKELVCLGYKANSVIEKKGDFAKRGGSINIYPIGNARPIKVDFFDDLIETIKEYDVETKKTLEKVDLTTLYPAIKIPIPKTLNDNFVETNMQKVMEQVLRVYSKGLTKNAEELRKKNEANLNAIKIYDYNEYTYSYFNTLYKDSASILDYLPENTILLWSEFTTQNGLLRKTEETIEKAVTDKIEKGLMFNLIGKLYIPLEDILKKSRNFCQVRFSTLNDMPNVNLQFTGTTLPSFANKFDDLVEFIKKSSRTENKNVVIISAQPQRALTILKEKDCHAVYGESSFNLEEKHIWVLKGEISKGFIFNDSNIVFISDAELFGWSQRPLKKKSKDKKDTSQRLSKVQDIRINDYVVHETHGIGQYRGLRTIELEGRKREYFEIFYAKEDKLLVPIEQINLLSLYRGSTDTPPKLNKMGGMEWENLKSRVRDSLKSIAADLIKLYAERISAKGYAFPLDTEWQGQMEDAFPYEETEDQLKAILETKEDMEKAKPMDRLICGDVGFGKTEVAIRAAFKAVMSGKQVAVLAPTTVLSQQLYDVMQARFAPYPVKLAILNRFRSDKESKQIYEEIKKGNLDLVVSTHKILMKTPEFFDLGLVIIDEEHKFGVAHKEKLKQFKTSVDVLTMSATPIPRTLYMSLSGARDMSLIETPPKNRFPVQTKLLAYSPEVIKNAILYELEREGQVYFVHNRVEGLAKLYKELTELLPDVSIGIGHGQLPEHELENAMLGFNSREYDVLLCTTIIESGLDIPSANTIIINDVHLFGLAQLYQLRGRVGRSDVQAFAYFLYPQNHILTDEAKQRLQVLQEMSSLGSGYQVALRDMEIRGVGDLLGGEQHGNVLSLGYDTYCQILEETVNELKPEDERTSNFVPTVVIDINLPCYIPDNWIDDYKLKMQYYRRLAVVQDLDLLEEMKKELYDNYGEIPSSTKNLLQIVKVRILASKLGITNIKSAHKEIKIKHKISELDWRKLVNTYEDLRRWQWSLTELTTKATLSPEDDLIIIEKLLNILVIKNTL